MNGYETIKGGAVAFSLLGAFVATDGLSAMQPEPMLRADKSTIEIINDPEVNKLFAGLGIIVVSISGMSLCFATEQRRREES